MSASESQDLRAEPNLTPLLDVVFQLITFFMLVINFSNDNHDQRVRLPIAGSARPIDDPSKAAEDRLVLNIDKQGQLLFNGKNFSTSEAVEQIKFQASLIRFNARAAGLKFDSTTGLPTRVVIRADKELPFSTLYTFMTACQNNGFQKFDLKAMSGP